MNYRLIAEQVFLAGVNRVTPEQLITKMMVLKMKSYWLVTCVSLLRKLIKYMSSEQVKPVL